MNLLVSYIVLYIFQLAYGNENEDRKILSISRRRFEGTIDYQAKHDHRIRELEQKFRIHELEQDTRILELEQIFRKREMEQDTRIRELEQIFRKCELEQDTRIRELEQKFRIHEMEQDTRILELEQIFRKREMEQDTRIRELELNIRNHKLDQADRIRKLEHAIQIQSKQIGDITEDCTFGKKDNLIVNNAFVHSDMNTTISKTADRIDEEANSKELKHVHIKRHGKKDNMERMSDRKRLLLRRHQTLIFDDVQINLGSAFSRNSGLFSAPGHGIYVFSWTVVADEYGFVYTEIVINSTPYGSILTNSQDVRDFHTVTGIVVADVNKGDEIYIRTNPNYPIKGRIVSDSSLRTSFSGWKIADI
ncbi:unnamed protein product [Mytilus edulis]|uniref:C1q domain-containing protein n=1 Tax=Mytilus edulis TaxID=6550 RepID=A0A8S3VLD5_MYTED|nr:unnamed protein product [Mytilus edulis]